MEQPKWTPGQASIVERMVADDAYQLLLERSVELENRANHKLGQQATSWEETQYLRGKLAGLREFHPEVIMREVAKSRESEKP